MGRISNGLRSIQLLFFTWKDNHLRHLTMSESYAMALASSLSTGEAMQPLNADHMADLLGGLSCQDEPTIVKRRSMPLQRSVKFPEEDHHMHLFHEGPDVDILAANRRDIWYQYEELKHIKRKALVLSKEAQRYGLGSILTNTYGKPSDETQEALQTWVRNASSRRGLERWINDEYAAKRSDIRKRTIQSVLRAQMKMQESAVHDPDYSMKVLSRLSEAFSVDSKEFARGMGMADEATSKLATQDPECESVCGDEEGSTAGSVTGPPLPILKAPKKMDPHLLRKAPLRLNSPRTVIPGRGPLGVGGPPRAPTRNLGLSSSSESADFRHFY